MYQQDSDTAPVSFCDVVACFSEVEWKLLHHWQKELFENVMKEIHQALSSLGPRIATSVFSLRPNEKEDLCPVDYEDSEIRGSLNPSPRDMTAQSDVLSRKTRKATQYMKDTLNTEHMERCDGPNTGPRIATSVFSLRPNEKEDLCPMDYEDSEIRGSLNPSPRDITAKSDVLFRKTRKVTQYMKDTLNTEHMERCDGPNTGPRIATSVFSLRPNEKEDLCPVDYEDSEIRDNLNPSPRDMTAKPDVLFRKTRKATQYMKDTLNTEHMERCDGPITGYQILNSDNILRQEQELESSLMDRYDTGGESSTGPSLGHADIEPIVSFTIKEEEETYSIDNINSERTENITSTTKFPFYNIEIETNVRDCHGMEREEIGISHNSGPDVTAPAASVGIIEERETYPIDIQDYKRREPINSSTGGGSMNRKRNFGQSVKCNDKSIPSESTTRRVRARVVQSVDERTHSTNQMWSEYDQEPRGEKTIQWQIDCNQLTHSKVQQQSDTYSTFDSTMHNVNIIPCDSTPLQSCSTYTCPENEQTFCQKNSQVEHQRAHTEKGRYKCIQCEKSFSAMSKLITHARIHTGERPYHCNICRKSFNHKGDLLRHHKIHTGERPYQCSVCAKSFNRKDYLLVHQNMHTKTQHSIQIDPLETGETLGPRAKQNYRKR